MIGARHGTPAPLRRRLAIPRLPDGRAAAEFAASVGATLFVLLAFWKVGPVIGLFFLLNIACALLALSGTVTLAYAVLALAPLPSIGLLVAQAIPTGSDPLNVLVVLGFALALHRASGLPLRRNRLMVALIVLNFGLLVVAWFRTYGGFPDWSGYAPLVVKPLIVLAAAVVIVQSLPRAKLIPTVATGFAVTLGAVCASVVLQKLGIYRVYNQESRDIKQFGGLMLGGNAAGALLAMYAIPTYVLLRSVGRARIGVAIIVVTIPVLLITLSRTSLIAFAVGLVALVALDRRRLSGFAILGFVGVVAALWAKTGGYSQVSFLLDRAEQNPGDINAQLSGRAAVWDQAMVYLDQGRHWFVGGGLDAFQQFNLTSPLQYAWATHNMYLDLLTTGGLAMLAAFAALAATLWWSVRGIDADVATAIRLVIVSLLVIGFASDVELFSRTQTWFWVLIAVAMRLRAEVTERAAEPGVAPAPPSAAVESVGGRA